MHFGQIIACMSTGNIVANGIFILCQLLVLFEIKPISTHLFCFSICARVNPVVLLIKDSSTLWLLHTKACHRLLHKEKADFTFRTIFLWDGTGKNIPKGCSLRGIFCQSHPRKDKCDIFQFMSIMMI